MKRIALHALAAALCLAALPAAAQQEPVGANGMTHPRVRVWVPEMGGSRPLRGRLAALGPDKLVLVQADSVAPGAPRVDIPLSMVERVEQSLGRVPPSRGAVRAATTRGALAGLLVGAGVGVVLGISSGSEGHEKNAKLILPFAGGFTLAGGVIGATVGARGYEQWVAVPLPVR